MKALTKNIFREIKHSKSRFLSIFAIIALSTGFFSGIKSSSPSMITTSYDYLQKNNLMDIRIVSTAGFDDDDIRAIKNMDETVDILAGYCSDLIVTDNNIDSVVRVYSLPEKTDTADKLINETILVEGRYPSADGECVIDSYYFRSKGMKLGHKIRFNEQTDNIKTKEFIKQLEYKVVGVIDTPLYLTYQRGNTTVGDGKISFYIMLQPDQFITERYTNAYVTTKASELYYDSFSDEYKNEIKKEKDDFQKLSDERIDVFRNTTLADAKKELSDAEAEFNEKKKEAEDTISDGEKELYDGQQEMADKLSEGIKKLNDGEKELADGKEQLEEGKKKYNDGIEEGKAKLTEGQAKYDEGLAQYNKGKLQFDTEISKAQSQLDKAQGEFDTQYKLFYETTKPQAETKLNLLRSAIELCNSIIEETERKINDFELITGSDTELTALYDKLDEYKSKVNEYAKQYDSGMDQLEEGEKKLNDAKAQLEEANKAFEQKKAEGMAQLNDAKIQLDSAKSQLETGKLEYDTALVQGMLELQQAENKLTEGEKELEKGKEELLTEKASAMLKMKSAREKLAAGKAEARTQLADAEAKLADARENISNLDDARWIIFDRTDNTGFSGLIEDALRVDKVAAVLPVFFLLIAALVCLTTMTRMVEERRTEIGTLKALGYSNFKIISKYLIYSALASVSGSIAGAVIGISSLPFIIVDTYSMLYTLPPTILSIDYQSFIFSAATGILCTCVVSVITCMGELKQNPASLMRPKAPKPGKRILLEYITPLWAVFNFITKVTFRNLFRYKSRLLMTVIGIAGCTALIIGGLGLKDSLSVIAPLQYDELTVYDEIYSLKSGGTVQEKAYLMSKFHADKRFAETALVDQNNISIQNTQNEKKFNYYYIVASDINDFEKFFHLRDRVTHEKKTLTDNGIIISERISQLIGAGKGEKAIINIDDTPYTVDITDIAENYAGNYICMTPAYYEKITGKTNKYHIVYTQLTEDGKQNEKAIADEWMEDDDILTVFLLKEQLEGIISTLDSLNIIVFVVVLCAAMLAMVVLYNLTNINISERIREIATIKVLGFYDLETASYIYRENIFLTVAGALAGLPLGTLFISFIIDALQMEIIMFPKYVTIMSYLIGFALTVVFSLFVNFIMFFRMKKVSMVESLKSIE